MNRMDILDFSVHKVNQIQHEHCLNLECCCSASVTADKMYIIIKITIDNNIVVIMLARVCYCVVGF